MSVGCINKLPYHCVHNLSGAAKRVARRRYIGKTGRRMVTVTGTRPDFMVAFAKAYLSARNGMENKSNPPEPRAWLWIYMNLHHVSHVSA